jgi:CheY-like chemotaxis protein
MKSASYTVLLVEDSESDVLLVKRAFKKAGVLNPLRVISDGESAVAYLSGETPYADREANPLPALVLLDLKLPRRSGFEVLAWIRAHPVLRGLPVVVLTSSTESRDIDRAYAIGASTYLVKPVALAPFVGMVDRLHAYWLMAEKPDLGAAEARR